MNFVNALASTFDMNTQSDSRPTAETRTIQRYCPGPGISTSTTGAIDAGFVR